MKVRVLVLLIFVSSNLLGQEVIVNCKSGDCANGYGTATIGTATYVGYFKNKKIHGQGTMTHANGDVYVGSFSEGVKSGRGGEYRRSNGDKVINCVFQNNVLKSGKYIFANGDTYEGGFEKWLFSGQGTFTYNRNSDKLHYIGEFVNGMKNGQGCLTYKNGTKEDGLWKDDVFQGIQGRLLGKINGKDVILKNDIVHYDNKTYSIFQEKKQIQSKLNILYFYIKESNEVVGIIKINNPTFTQQTYNPDIVSLSTDEALLKHLNRNKYNKPAKGVLTHIGEGIYYDENYCIWKLFPKKYSIYHNPEGKWENLKFVRPVPPNGNESYETILKTSSEVINLLEKDIYPDVISGTMVTTGGFQQTYNYVHVETSKFWRYIGHHYEDVDLHTSGWVVYAEFPITEGKPSIDERNRVETFIKLDNLKTGRLENFIEISETISKESDNTIILSQIGLTLQEGIPVIIDFEKFSKALKDGKFILNTKNGDKLYKLTYYGNQSQSAEMIQFAKKGTEQMAKVGNILTTTNLLTSNINVFFTMKSYIDGKISEEEYYLDIVMIGVGFVPITGWAVSGMYFIVKEIAKSDPEGFQKFLNDTDARARKFEEITGECFWRITP